MPIVSLIALTALRQAAATQRYGRALAASFVFLASLLVEAAGTLYPYLLPAFPARRGGISVADALPSPLSVEVALTVTIGGTIAVLAYSAAVWRGFKAKVRVE
jgi:cytochrome bd-type quinol oxidase subunit 2